MSTFVSTWGAENFKFFTSLAKFGQSHCRRTAQWHSITPMEGRYNIAFSDLVYMENVGHSILQDNKLMLTICCCTNLVLVAAFLWHRRYYSCWHTPHRSSRRCPKAHRHCCLGSTNTHSINSFSNICQRNLVMSDWGSKIIVILGYVMKQIFSQLSLLTNLWFSASKDFGPAMRTSSSRWFQ